MAVGGVRVVVADDHPSVRENLRYIFNGEPDLEVVAVAKDGLACLKVCREIFPDVLVLDDEMPGIDGLEAARRLRTELPDIRIVMYTLRAEVCDEASDYGVAACLTKDVPPEMLIRAIRDAAGTRTHDTAP